MNDRTPKEQISDAMTKEIRERRARARAQQVQDQMREKYSTRPGLEGPFNFAGRVLYYDPREGQYYDPRTDFYVEQAEMDLLVHQRTTNLLKA